MTAGVLPLFNDSNRCPKCQRTATSHYEPPRAAVKVHRLNAVTIYSDHPLFEVTNGEWIRRICATCHYEWAEACLDS